MRIGIALLPLALLLAAAPTSAQPAPPDEAGIEFFEKKIRPLFAQHCYECHSARADEIKGKLLLDTREGVLKGGATGPAIVPSDPDKSLLITAIRYKNDDLQMPPDNKLPDAAIADLEAWVKMGAPDPRQGATTTVAAPTTNSAEWIATLEKGRKYWSFQKPVDHPLPTVKDESWSRQSLDRFILAKLEEKNLTPAPQTDRRTLIRRAYFDLIGLPPPASEVEAFVKNDFPDAYEKLIDKLLASPLYGQRWARHWLDVVRYTDSFDTRVTGGEQDVAFAWRYRDWVVDAFNNDLPYNDFVTQQIAGDLIPNLDSKKKLNKPALIATGVYVLGEWGGGDSDKDKLITDIVDDQVDLTGRAFLGITLSCARCHDHKFDPISAKDYYGLAGIFFSTHILPDPGPKTSGPMNLRIPLMDEEDKAKRKVDEDRVALLTEEMEKVRDDQYASIATELLPQTDKYLLAVWEYDRATKEAASAQADRLRDSKRPSIADFAKQRNLNPYALSRWLAFLSTPELKLLTKHEKNTSNFDGINALKNPEGGDAPIVLLNTKDVQVETLPGLKLPPKSVSMHPSPTAGIAVAWRSPIAGRVRVTGKITDGHETCGDGVTWSVSRARGTSPGELASGNVPNGTSYELSQGAGASTLLSVPVSPGDMIQLAILPKAEYTCDTTNVELQIAEIEGEKRVWNLAKDVLAAKLESANPAPDKFGNDAVWHFHDMIAIAQAAVAANSPTVRYLKTKITGGNESAMSKVAREVLDALMSVQQDLTKHRGDEAKLAAIRSTPTGSFYELLASPRGPFWSPARSDDKNLPAPALAKISTRKSEHDKLKAFLAQPIPMAQAMQEGGTPKSMFAGIQDIPVHIRGRYDRLGELVPRRFPEVIAGENQRPIKEGSGRLDLARWITSPDHPLTARVIVNRIWQHHFGNGIVRTSNNFGKLGTPPSHPELLDHLAVNFVRSGWSMKKLHRAIMLSATYMQSSIADPQTIKADPDNLLLSRMSRRKLEAEALRDTLLSVSGTLDTTANGPAINDLNTPRRSLYVMTIRSDRNNYRTLFDAADPAAIVEKRVDSTVAPQALFLMNHPFAIERGKQLAARAVHEGGSENSNRIDWLYRTLFSRPPEPDEMKIGQNFLTQQPFKDKAWQAYCQLLICTNEFMYVD